MLLKQGEYTMDKVTYEIAKNIEADKTTLQNIRSMLHHQLTETDKKNSYMSYKISVTHQGGLSETPSTRTEIIPNRYIKTIQKLLTKEINRLAREFEELQ